MKNKIKYALFALLAMAVLGACDKKSDNGGYGLPLAGSSLQASSPVTIGMATNNTTASDPTYIQTLAANASQTTFESAMTHGAIVQADGSLNFSAPDAQYAAVTAKGLKVWGNSLCWYQSQNTTYLNNVIGGTITMPNLLPNPDFEEWSNPSSAPDGWVYANGNGTYGNFSQGTEAANVHSGSSSLAMNILQTTTLGSSWHLQLVSPAFPTVVGHVYNVTFWAKASTGGCTAQYEWDHNGNPQYNSTALETAWTQYTCAFGNPMAASVSSTTISFDMAANPVGANIYLDNIVITDKTAADSLAAALASPEEKIRRVDEALHNWVTDAVTHYKGQVTGWDVVKDLFADNGAIRTNSNTSTAGHSDWFVWSEYLGKNAGVTAFNAAHAADPSALLFINETGIEGNSLTSSAKLDSLITYVQWLKGQGVQVDGIGTEMHVTISTAKAGIDYMFQKLATTGLKIRISELDVKVNSNDIFQFALTPQVSEYQATTYHDVVGSYLKNVPAAQRQDITVWGVNDGNSQFSNGGKDFPLLFDDSYAPKPAYNGVLQGLQGK